MVSRVKPLSPFSDSARNSLRRSLRLSMLEQQHQRRGLDRPMKPRQLFVPPARRRGHRIRGAARGDTCYILVLPKFERATNILFPVRECNTYPAPTMPQDLKSTRKSSVRLCKREDARRFLSAQWLPLCRQRRAASTVAAAAIAPPLPPSVPCNALIPSSWPFLSPSVVVSRRGHLRHPLSALGGNNRGRRRIQESPDGVFQRLAGGVSAFFSERG